MNIPVKEAIDITHLLLIKNNIDRNTTTLYINLLKVILFQNYFTHEGKYYSNSQGIAMGSPILGLIAEIFLQFCEQLLVEHWMDNSAFRYYTRYVDDIRIIFDRNVISRTKLIHYLDLTINRHPTYTENQLQQTSSYMCYQTILQHINRQHTDLIYYVCTFYCLQRTKKQKN